MSQQLLQTLARLHTLAKLGGEFVRQHRDLFLLQTLLLVCFCCFWCGRGGCLAFMEVTFERSQKAQTLLLHILHIRRLPPPIPPSAVTFRALAPKDFECFGLVFCSAGGFLKNC